MQKIEKRIARIESTMLGYEDHGMLTATLYLDYGGSGQGAGLKFLKGESLEKEIRGILKICGVSNWESLKGRTIYAYSDYGRVYAIEQLPIDGNAFYAFDDAFIRPEED